MRQGSSLHRLHETDLLHDDTTKSMAIDTNDDNVRSENRSNETMTHPDVLKLSETEVETNHNELIVSSESGEQNSHTETKASVGRQRKDEPTVNSMVDFQVDPSVSTEKFTARILSRAGKKTGKKQIVLKYPVFVSGVGRRTECVFGF